MAVIPQVDVSTRKVETSPSLHYFPSMAGENGRALGGAITAAANGLDRIFEVKRRADEREAEYSVLQADNFVRNGWLGNDTQDPQTGDWVHTPGVADRNWEQMRDDKTTALDEMKKLQTAVREQKFYTDLSPEQRKVFERKWIFKADQHTRTAQEHHQRLTQAKIIDETKRTIEMRGAEVAKYYGSDDLTYTKIAGRNALLNWADLQGTALNEQSREMLDDPRCNFNDIAKSQGWDEKTRALKFEQYRKTALGFDINRITAFQKAAATGQRLGDYTPEQCAEMADRITDGLNGNAYGLRPDGTKKGTGWLGNVGTAENAITEFSVRDGDSDGEDAVKDADGNYIDYPTLVPGLNEQEIEVVKKAASGDKEVFKSEEWKSVIGKAKAHAKKQIAAGKSVWANSGTGPMSITDAEANEIKAETAKARHLLDGVRASVHKQTGEKLAVNFRKRIEGLEDTRVMFERRAQMQTAEEYAKEINGLVDGDALDRKTGDQYIANYKKLLDHCDDIRKKEKRGEGVWLKQKDRNGKLIDVFEPYRHGNGKSETDQSQAEKYTKVDRNGNTPFFDDPARGMEELDFDYKMGNISLPFYNAQMAKMRVFSDTKAKAAFVKVFGCNGDIFPEKDVAEFRKQGIDTGKRSIWAKTREWNRGDGYTGANWLADAQKNYLFEGGEKEVSLEQQAELCEIIKSMTADGMDPTETIHNYLAPIFKEWAQTDLVNRLDPNFKIGGRNFRERMMDSKRYATPYDPKTRDSRLQARMKKAYGDVTPDEQ